MSSFLKTWFIHDETAPSESLVLLLKGSFSRQHHIHFFLVFSFPRLSPRIVCFALGLPQRQTGIACNVSIFKLLKTVGWRTVWTRFFDNRFSKKGSAVETSWTPLHKEKFLSCDLPVPGACAQGTNTCISKSTVMFSCTLAD